MDDSVGQLYARPYQEQMEDIAMRQNTIIHLPTGSGKTFIAVRLITRFRGDLLKPWGEGGKRTFFLVNNVPLVLQQKTVIENLCPIKNVGAYSSEDKVDFWNKAIWDAELRQNQIMVMTSMILCNMLTHQYIKLEQINLLIFDECHHAVDDHPMRLIMKFFEDCPSHKQPRVLGLTATLLNSNVTMGMVKSTLKDLETTFHATIATVDELGEVLKYSSNPRECVQYYRTYTLTPAAEEAVRILNELMGLIFAVKLPKVIINQTIRLERGQTDITTDPKKIIKLVRNMVAAMIMYIEEMGVYGGAVAILAYLVLLEGLKRKASSKEEELLYKFTITDCTRARMILLKSMKNDEGYDKIIKHSSEKILLMLNVLKEYNVEKVDQLGTTLKVNISKKPLSGLMFVQQRFTAKVIFNILKDAVEFNPDEFGFLKHDFIVGINVNPFNNTRKDVYNKKLSEMALLNFNKKELNLLIATSVIEEGIDIPQCLLVLRYDPPLEYRSYIQSKGRGRSSEASYVILIDEKNKSKFHSQYSNFQVVEKHIQQILIGTSNERPSPTIADITGGLYEEDDIPPYVTEHGARLTSAAAISLLCRYCYTLPHDQFTVISAMWVREQVFDTKFQAELELITIILPIESAVREPIKGSPMWNLKLAKRSAALNACIKLHQAGELDAITLLPKRHGTVDFEEPNVKECFLNWPWDVEEEQDLPKAGTKKRIRKHQKVFPKCLNGPVNFSSNVKSFYLHVIRLNAAFAEPKDTREHALYKLLKSDSGFGFLSQNPLPKTCDFPMFLTVGEVSTSIDINFAMVNLDKPMFELLKSFNHFLFNQVLNVMKKFLVHTGDQNCLYVVPVTNDDIDWDVMKTYKEIPPFNVPSVEERKQLIVRQEDYQYSVVTPWYRASIWPDIYIVARVLEYLTPTSHFDDASVGTYATYYNSKYNLSVVGRMDQPLLEARNISSRMNCLLPRTKTLKSLTDKQKKLIAEAEGDDKPKSYAEVLIPEFCIKYDFPGVFWYKAMMLPSIIHRLTMLLIANDLRTEIATATRYGVVDLPRNHSWKPVTVDFYIAIKSLLSSIETPTIINTIDRINDPIDENAPRPPIKSMKQSIYELQKKKIGREYPWDENSEPIDVERNLSSVTVMDIECYEQFVSTPLIDNFVPVKSPPRVAAHHSTALLPPPLKYNDNLKILKQTLTGIGPELCDILAALTTINSHDTHDLERVETLGDSFLKFAASLYLFHKFPTLSEGQLTNIKGRLIGNRNLYYAGERIKLGGRMKMEQFSPKKDFMVPGFFAPKQLQEFIEAKKIRPSFLLGLEFSPAEVVSGQLTAESWLNIKDRFENSGGVAEPEPLDFIQNAMQCYIGAQAVSDKSVADCVEAIIGTYLLSGGPLAAIRVLEWLRIIPEKDNLANLLVKKVPTALSQHKASLDDIKFLINSCQQDVEEILDYKFNDASFILEALSHPSYIRNRYTRSYERLEFLGDAIIDFLVTTHIFENCDNLKPGDLTDLRSALVNNVTFAAYVVKLGLHKFLLSQQNPVLDNAILTFVEHQKQRNHEIVEDVLYLIDETDCHVAEYIEVPKLLSDIFESLVGAIYLDSGGSLETVWRVVYKIMHREIQAFSSNIPKQPVRLLYESIHACPIFLKSQLTKSEVPKVMIGVTISKEGVRHTVYGVGANKFQAKRAAAKLALKILM